MTRDVSHFERLSAWTENDIKPAVGKLLRGDDVPSGLPRGGSPEPLDFQIPDELDRALESASQTLSLTPSEILREALAEWLGSHGQPAGHHPFGKHTAL
ncbi:MULTISPECIES: hypothetical protein [Arthrobacter]|uniref:Ribbon-helix-helix protein CopG domain-containing protein n=1 Tax=Arthrobacter terricola TaxID=2547396 RepID=A0A4V2ZTP5_9MICC|nr:MULTISPECIES: hypothetical protein [Arthrobacter]MBT8160756.1 ribbon-helix-helix domain-containing protein [Arthrobacter sp. GN70]TDF97904.1 hypothetical protein E1809_07830 [Arthrobacter terricola]